MKPNRLYALIFLFLAMLSRGESIAAMQSLPQSSDQSTVKVILSGIAATGALIGSALYARNYLQNPKIIPSLKTAPPQEVPVSPQLIVVEVYSCKSDIAQKIKELYIVPTAIADLIAGYAAVEPKPIQRAPFYGFQGMRPAR